jgi:hypothetical protein
MTGADVTKENSMRRVAIFVAIGGMLGAAAGALAEDGKTAEQVCRKAEINPVTGHVLCIEPRGAYVPPPPEDIAPSCDETESRGQWTWSPNCRDAQGS